MKSYVSVIVMGVLVLAAVGCSALEISEEAIYGTEVAQGAASDVGQEEAAQAVVDTPTAVTLATPTPKLAPPTPTPRPPTPTPEVTESDGAAQAVEEEQEEVAPQSAVTDIMVEIPAGTFMMGSNVGDLEDEPAHEVDLPAYEIDVFEVSNADFAAFAEATGYETFAEQQGYQSWRDEWGDGGDNLPVVIVTWEDATAYCEWVGKRLPTEAEWEKAARGDDGRTYPWGNDWDASLVNGKEAGLRGPVVGGSFGGSVSPYGVEDMIGNVWEWTADWYQPYPGGAAEDPYFGEVFRVTRGGGWFDEKPQLNTYNRNAADPQKTANDDLGFRCAR
jgi:formylglycine-generating enzyme required for sulfatase activity